MEDEIAQQFRRGEAREFFETPEDFEEHMEFFFNRLKDIVSKENMIYKWKSAEYTLDMLHNATEMAEVDIVFLYNEGFWYVERFGCKEDLMNLPIVAKIFSQMYRFQEGHGKNPKERLKYGGEFYQISGQRND